MIEKSRQMRPGFVYVSAVHLSRQPGMHSCPAGWLGLTPVGVASEPESFGFEHGPEPWI
jgi:hypothetical protein